MAAITPVYRMTITENNAARTVITPHTNAPHSDEFRIATASGVPGYRPYMGFPGGWRGVVDLLTRQVEKGRMTVEILDRKVGTGNAERWMTAFTGDGRGRNLLVGKRAFIEVSLDGGDTWSPHFTGRVRRPALSGRVWMEIEMRDMAEELEVYLFVDNPTVDYAHHANLWPLGLIHPFGTERQIEPAIGFAWHESARYDDDNLEYPYHADGTNTPIFYIEQDEAVIVNRWKSRVPGIVTSGFHQILTDSDNDDQHPYTDKVRIWCRYVDRDGVTQEGEFRMSVFKWTNKKSGGQPGDEGREQVRRRWWLEPYFHRKDTGTGHRMFLHQIGIYPLPESDPSYIPLPPNYTEVEFYVYGTLEPSESAPILINDVHPVQLWKDILDGKFSLLNRRTDVEGLEVGDPLLSVDYDEAAFDALIADDTFPKFRGIITDKEKLNTWVESQICLPYGLGYYFDGSGQIVPVDMRPPAADDRDELDAIISGLKTIEQEDLADSSIPSWSQNRSDAVTRVKVDGYFDSQPEWPRIREVNAEYPDIPAGALHTLNTTHVDVRNFNNIDMGVKELSFQPIGFRFDQEPPTGVQFGNSELARRLNIIGYARNLARGIIYGWGEGPQNIQLVCRHTDNTKAVLPGDLVLLDIDEIPNAASNIRGGQRLARCSSRIEDGLTVEFLFVDLGSNSVSVAPALGTPTLGEDDFHTVLLPVTHNSRGESVTLETAVTDTSVTVRPGESDPLWMFSRDVEGDADEAHSVVVSGLPSGSRIWLRGRSQTDDLGNIRLPSEWAYASSHVDTDSVNPPSELETVDIDSCSATMRWFNGENLPVEIEFDGTPLPRLIAGTVQLTVSALHPGTRYRWSIRHVDERGGGSVSVETSFMTDTEIGSAPEAVGVRVLSGRKSRF